MTRYTAVAIVLHWAIAAAILANLGLGWWMHRAIDVAATQARAVTAYQLHKSIGLTVLVLTLARLLWRLAHRPPPLPAAMRAWERTVARALHWAFYALMVVVPLSGWTYVSAQWRGDAPLHVPTLWFGLFEVPHLFDAAALPVDERKAVAVRTFTAHLWLAWSMGGLLVLHVAAALKHRFVNRDTVLASMAPRAGAGIVAVVAAAVALALFVAPVPAVRETLIGSAPGGWRVHPSSEIAFWGVHAEVPFRGRFQRWQADLRVDAELPEQSTIEATVETGSAVDGVPLHEETLPQAEWFDVATYPTASFRATRITRRDDGEYDVDGVLRIKDRALPLPAPLLLSIGRDELLISGEFILDRRDANLGMESDPHGDWVSRTIGVAVRVRAAAPEK